MSRAKLLRNYNVSDWKRNTIAEMHSRNLVGEKRNLCLARALNTSPAMQSCCHKYLDEFHVPSDRILNRAWLRVGLKFRINYRLIIVRCRSTKLQFFLVVCIFFCYSLFEVLATRFMFANGSTSGRKSRSCWSGANGAMFPLENARQAKPRWELLSDFSDTEIRTIISKF